MSKDFMCGHCRKQFGSLEAVASHSDAVHGRARYEVWTRMHGITIVGYDRAEPDSDESVASQAIDASLRRAMGEDMDQFDDHLADLAEGKL